MTAPRWLWRIALLLFLGAVVNVVVAWGCALWSPVRGKIKDPARKAMVADLFLSRVMGDRPPPSTGRFGELFEYERTAGVGLGFGFRQINLHDMNQGTPSPFDGEWRAVIQAGWPALALDAWSKDDLVVSADPTWANGLIAPARLKPRVCSESPWLGGPGVARPLPLRVLPIGFAVNTLLYAGALGATWWCLGLRRRLRRLRRGVCGCCAYDVGALQTCPECGARTPAGRAVDRGLS